jgi:large subunit ribosomal protein L21
LPELFFPLPLPPSGKDSEKSHFHPGINNKHMIAVVKIAGQQYKVEKDQSLFVPHVEGKAGDKVEVEVLMVDADGKISVGADVKAKVKAEIVDHVKGDKVIAYKQKRRKGFRKKLGHRTLYTQILIKDIK